MLDLSYYSNQTTNSKICNKIGDKSLRSGRKGKGTDSPAGFYIALMFYGG